MDEDEAELLAELRAISSQPASANRFGDDDDDKVDRVAESRRGTSADEDEEDVWVDMPPSSPQVQNNPIGSPMSSPRRKSRANAANLPPWKLGRSPKPKTPDRNTFSPTEETVEPVATNATSSAISGGNGSGIRGNPPSTFTGERGGAAEDEELLAELKAVSSKSSSADRFAGGDDDDAVMQAPVAEPPKPKAEVPLPPWKRGRPKQQPQRNSEEVDVVIATPRAPVPAPTAAAPTLGIKSDLPSTFTGERGGAAEDEEMLAELRAISSKSSSADRFADSGNDDQVTEVVQAPIAEPPKLKPRDDNPLPPWKRGRPKQPPQREEEVDVVIAAPPAAAAAPTLGLKSDLPSTFTGERGGAAEDEEILAELRAISSKSSSADRFADSGNDEQITEVVQPPVAEPSIPKPRDDNPLPPWKRGRPKQPPQREEEVDVVIAAPPAAAPAAAAPTLGIKSDLPSTFTGERGGAAEDEEMLAELRAISSKSSSADRFADSANDDGEVAQVVQAPIAEPPKPRAKPPLPPWKRGRPKQQPQRKSEEVDVVIATPPVPAPAPTAAASTLGIKSDLPSTFTGERGGAAEDEEMLAELRAISSKSSSADRFADSGNDEQITEVVQPPVAEPPKPKPRDDNPLPPWKRGRPKQPPQREEEVDVVIAAPPAPAPAAAAAPTLGIKSDLPSTFAGERGGAAEDEELLAELRAISSKSSSADRFAGGDDNGEAAQVVRVPAAEPPKPKPKQREDAPLPPWKRVKPKQPPQKEEEADIVVAAPPAPTPVAAKVPSTLGIKSDLPSTFVGERGGDAEDEELLAELRAISSKSSSAGRFADNGNDNQVAEVMQAPVAEPPKPKAKPRDENPLPPWKRGRPKQPPQKEEEVDMVIAAPPAPTPATTQPPALGIKSDLPSTFTGERGGAAEDEELLAELRAISSKTGSSSRFAQERDDGAGDSSEKVSAPPVPKAAPVKVRATEQKVTSEVPEATMVQTKQPSQESEGGFTRSDLPAALTDKNWKTRSAAYELLGNILLDVNQGSEPTGDLDSNSILEGLDEMIATLVQDANAGALDKALQFALLYADYCRTAGSAEQTRKIVVALLKKNAFSSRPTTLKLASALTLKLMEVGSDGATSVHSAVQALLNEGLASKKPKVIQAASSLVLEAAYEFGAACLPLASIISSVPKMLVNTNSSARDCGVNLVAEICRTLRSKAPLQGVIDGMKKAQVSELDSLLSKQTEPTPVRKVLRSQKQVAASTSSSPEDALASLGAGTKELEDQLYASRSAVNLPAKVAKSEYSSKIQLQKWSEKVAALNIVIECGGEKPYKIMQPSHDANFAPLIGEMKKLLSHTHFAVASKAMEVLSMLAEGVGEKLFPYLRPFLTTLLTLSKDKKLTRAIVSCLDALFGNILAFDHLLETNDSLSSALDERTQKNALVRASTIEFLGRCVKRGDAAGPRSHLSVQSVTAIGALCVSKLDDSDAAVRKAAMEAIRTLQGLDDPDSIDAVRKIVYSLKSTNARAYKALSKDVPEPARSTQATSASSSRGPVAAKPTQSKATLSAGANEPSKTQKARPATAGKGTYADSSPDKKEVKSSAIDSNLPDLDNAVAAVASLRVPQWDAPEDEGGILAGLEASKWLLRQDAIKSLTAFIESGELDSSESPIGTKSSSILTVVREHTRGFKETNVNIMKAIIHLFIALCDYHEASECQIDERVMKDGADIAVQKISDRKLSISCKSLLTRLCVVSPPHAAVSEAFKRIKSIKSPVAHLEYLQWVSDFCNDFGAASLGPGISEIALSMIDEAEFSNPKVSRQALLVLGNVHTHLGPGFKALCLSLSKKPALKDELEKCFDQNKFDASIQGTEWSKRSIVTAAADSKEGPSSSGGGLAFDVPRTDLFSQLPDGCLDKMGSKDGKTAWKKRKEALEEVEHALKQCSGLLDTSSPKLNELVELTRAVRDRLVDTQINLKPSAARIIGHLLSSVDKATQAKLGKLVFGPLINAAMNDIKKLMRESSLDAIRTGTTSSSLDGGELNAEALEALVIAFIGEVNETSIRAGGLAEVLLLLLGIAEHFPNLDEVASTRGQTLGERLSSAIVLCLTSSKSETRSAGSSLLDVCIENGVVSLESIRKATERLKPATQRTLGPMIAKFARNAPSSARNGKENLPTGDSRVAKERTAPVAAVAAPAPTKSMEREAKPVVRSSVQATSRDQAPKAETLRHPLVGRNGMRALKSSKTMVWPEFPEEPLGSVIFGNLRKYWTVVLPPKTASDLFPSSGIRKQDDAMDGIEVLSRALEIDRSSDASIIEQQLEPVLKWISYVLCSKEVTVGLQALLSLTSDLITLLAELKRELSDSEAIAIVPFIFEKASISKGRFKDAFMDIVSLLQSESLLPPKRLGGIVCSAIIERSAHAKARVMACQIGLDCVEKTGLAGIGKKGVTSTAKMLSEETIPENRAAALDLMEVILSKMNGEIQRLARICGPNLSEKAREMVEERWQKRPPPAKQTIRAPSTDSRERDRSTPSQSEAPRDDRAENAGSQSVYYEDQLPALSLRPPSGREMPTAYSRAREVGQDSSRTDPFAFSVTARAAPVSAVTETDHDISEKDSGRSQAADIGSTGTESSFGTAASLRARLLKIREKSKGPEESSEELETALVEAIQDAELVEETSPEAEFGNGLESIKVLVSKNTPLAEEDVDLLDCIETLKKFHAALSKQQKGNFGLSVQTFSALRQLIAENLSDTIEHLTRLIGYAFNCGETSLNAALSIPLLSVGLATLMALFRDPDLSIHVSQDDLTLLIRETGTALLDSRLASTSKLDEATASQMVRAINKLAVQAATGASRHTALLSLMTLQQQLSLESFDDETTAFNSRLSRVVAKLFARVVKAEEGGSNPFSPEVLDTEALLCAMEDLLVACQQAEHIASPDMLESIDTCNDMVRMLVLAIIKAHGDASFVRTLLDDLGVDPHSSALGVLISSCEEEAVESESEVWSDAREDPLPVEAAFALRTERPSNDVATLVSDLGSAPQGPVRDAALNALRDHIATHGKEELNAHLAQVSSPFRSFIEGELGPDLSPEKSMLLQRSGSSMSERLRNLRSRLQATELAVQTVVDEKPAESPAVIETKSESPVPKIPSPTKIPSPAKYSSKLSRPSPSKLAQPSSSKITAGVPSSSSSSQTLRERLLAAQDSRKAETQSSTTGESTASGRAAALRARLDAVKHQTNASN